MAQHDVEMHIFTKNCSTAVNNHRIK